MNYYKKSGKYHYWVDEKNRWHRVEDKPAIIYDNGAKFWYKFGKLHRLTGPAVLANGNTTWAVNDTMIQIY